MTFAYIVLAHFLLLSWLLPVDQRSCAPCGSVVLVEMTGLHTTDAANDLHQFAAELQESYEINVVVEDPIDIPEHLFNEKRQQYNGSAILKHLRKELRGRDSATTFLAIIPSDIYLSDHSTWDWAFGSRYSKRGDRPAIGLLSTHRMRGKSKSQRLHTMAGKYIGAMSCGFPNSENRKSIMYNHVLSADDVDAMGSVLCQP